MSQFTSHVHVRLSLVLLAIVLLCTIDGAPSTASHNPEAKARKQNNDNSATGSPPTHGGRPPSLTTYDQRQNGKYNIHVNIKDVKIIAVDGENLEGNLGDDTVYDYGDYDYDPAHLTISPLPIFGSGSVSITKPPKSTTKAPFTTNTATTTTTTTTKQPNAQSSSTGSGSSSTTDSTTSTTEPATTTLTLSVPVKDGMAKPHLKTNDSSSIVHHEQSAVTDQAVTATSTASIPPASNIIVIKPTSPVQYDYQDIPVQVIVDPIVRPKYRSNHQVAFPHSAAFHRQHDRHPIRRSSIQCHEGEYRDREGNCRARRSGILKLFRLLSSLNEKND